MTKLSRLTSLFAAFCLAFTLVGCSATAQNQSNQPSNQPTKTQTAEGELTAHFIDVGQGDSEFIELPDGKTMLIDSGEYSQAATVENYIANLGYSRIDYLVETHPHSDHMGSMSEIVKSFTIGEIYAPKVSHTTKSYENFLTSVADKGLTITSAYRGMAIDEGSSATIEILSPYENTDYDDLNDWSIVLKITYGDTSFLFTGDASSSVIDKAQAGAVNVLKVGHHGSKTSTSNELIASLKPSYAVIEVGTNNDYGHPHDKAISALKKNKVTTYRTDTNGNITATSNGSDIVWTTQKG